MKNRSGVKREARSRKPLNGQRPTMYVNLIQTTLLSYGGRVFKKSTMELELIRTYHPSGTNGKILFQDRLMMYSIELPWKDNLAQVSCIPEGRYELVKRWSLKFGRHLLVKNVPHRSNILIHPANDALQELKGCIAPVCLITGAGKGLRSRLAMESLTGLAYGVLEQRDHLFITIKSITL